jgi:hypothetical protein
MPKRKPLTKAGTPRKRAPGAGRPALPAAARLQERVTARLSPYDAELLAALCDAFDEDRPAIVRRALHKLAEDAGVKIATVCALPP